MPFVSASFSDPSVDAVNDVTGRPCVPAVVLANGAPIGGFAVKINVGQRGAVGEHPLGIMLELWVERDGF